MACCGTMNLFTGLPPVSSSLFLAGFAAMLINLDYSAKTKLNRTPLGHSIFSAPLWSMIFLIFMFILSSSGILDWHIAFELSVVFAASYITHLILDFFTLEGLYIFKGKRWLRINSTLLGMEPKKESSALLNIYLCIPSAVAIMVLVGIA